MTKAKIHMLNCMVKVYQEILLDEDQDIWNIILHNQDTSRNLARWRHSDGLLSEKTGNETFMITQLYDFKMKAPIKVHAHESVHTCVHLYLQVY